MSNKKYYLGKIIFSKEDTEMEEEWNVLYCTAKNPQEVLDLIAKQIHSDGSDDSPVKEDDGWVVAAGDVTKGHRYQRKKKSTYEEL